jgi:predicted nucleic acid-binding protein
MKRTFLVDTNHLSALINPVSRLRERLFQEHRTGGRFRSCVPVICEVEVGIQDSSHAESYRRAAIARYTKWTLLTSDRDFEALPDLRTENWVA